ncbi:MAG TPA: polyprenyl synthetase family protein [Chitinophagaceae bacterium]|jgi:geranylgeranyl pyrophosphate synthase
MHTLDRACLDFKMPDLAIKLRQTNEIKQLNEFIINWIRNADNEIQSHLVWQLLATPKYFRPITIFACYKSDSKKKVNDLILRSAVALEFIHNVSLIIDDILDRSRYRRGKLSLHCKFGLLPALMVSGYLFSAAIKIVSEDPYSVQLLSALMQRLGIAECIQWRLRRQPLGVEDWRLIASEDTGSMFETCARLGSRNNKLLKFGNLLGMLYHGCDDVADVRGDTKLGGTGSEDIRDGILTLPAAIAIRDVKVAALFRNKNVKEFPLVKEKFFEALDEAEKYLDIIAEETKKEALENSKYPADLLELIHCTRQLSGKENRI